MRESYMQLKVLVDSLDDDLTKALSGNKAAGTRVRKVMQEVKKKAQEIRQGVLLAKAG